MKNSLLLKNIFSPSYFFIGVFLSFTTYVNAQSSEWRLKKTVSAPVAKVIQPAVVTFSSPSTIPGVVDGNDIRIFPSSNTQAEVHVSINKYSPQNLIISANTRTSTFSQGRYKSNDGGLTWQGSDELVSGTTLGGDPSTAFDTNGNTYISTILNNQSGYGLVKALNNSNSWSNLISNVNTAQGHELDKEMMR